ncbi:uncharacterized protein C6orf47 homolog [Pangasianodon hypophthalmus]|uniref:uncharacterized protein C6orf47 homolog n=1 Tax=Pangasianodon hypophthalmus TaxID=310915 RepID=UPI002307C95C|nr:uncharacterized protein C6orf47 homolog [Pangasianodon hypophthalmus]XP_053087551.1 uncharacterized protein C6orf47 homolog [Pangasianodon hypophthalmus]
MSAVVGRVWAWINPGNLYRPWASKPKSEKSLTVECQERSRWSLGGLTSWVWGGWRDRSDQKTPTEEYWEAQEEILKPLEIEDLNAERLVTPPPQSPPRWWKRIFNSAFHVWPLSNKVSGLNQRNDGSWDSDAKDADFSDYGTPPPSPVPLSQRSSTFRFFAQSWSGEILPEHYEICFNFLRHLFDLFVVGFLWTVSPPAKFVLDVLGVQGALKLWLHGMAMFLVSSVGMAGLLWLVQEYLPQFALVYGIIQALVISVSVRQSVILGAEEDGKEDEDSEEETEDTLAQTQSSSPASKSVTVS